MAILYLLSFSHSGAIFMLEINTMVFRLQNLILGTALLLAAGCSTIQLNLPASPEELIVQAPLAPAAPTEKVHAEAPQSIFCHVVVKGDSLDSIALAYGAYVGDILRRNPGLVRQAALLEDAILNVPYYGVPATEGNEAEAKPEVKPPVPVPEAKPEVKPPVPVPEAKPEVKPPVPVPEAKPEVKPPVPVPQDDLKVKPAPLVPEAKPEAKPRPEDPEPRPVG
jgi:hypothetical protein